MKRIIIIAILLILVSFIPSNLCKATTIWSDDFDDRNLEGWKISGASYAGRDIETLVLAKGNCTAENQALQATGASKISAYTYVARPAGTSVGTYSFDVFFNEGGTFNTYTFVINFADKDEIRKADWLEWHGYEITVSDYGTVVMKRLDRANGNPILRDASGKTFKVKTGTWTHFDMSHDANGRWVVFVNGTSYLDIVDKEVLTFDYVGFWLQPGPSIDNVVVRDTIYVPPGSLKVTIKDSSGNALSGATVSSTKQPSGQVALSGSTLTDGTFTFLGLVAGNYTLLVSKSGYNDGLVQGVVISGAKTELSSVLQNQPSGGIAGYPIESIAVGLLICVSLISYKRLLENQVV